MNFFDLRNASKRCMSDWNYEKCIPTIISEHNVPKNIANVSANRYLQGLCTNRSHSSYFQEIPFWINHENMVKLRFHQFEGIGSLTILAVVFISELNTSLLLIWFFRSLVCSQQVLWRYKFTTKTGWNLFNHVFMVNPKRDFQEIRWVGSIGA